MTGDLKSLKLITSAIILFFCLNINAQQKNKARIHIIHADRSEYDEGVDREADRLIGDVVLRHDSTYFYSDSAHFNDKSQMFRGYSNVHIKVNDTTHIFSDSCKYLGETKMAELFSDVVLKDDSTILRTDYMKYYRSRHLATYPHHGTIDRNDKHLVSEKGYYRDDTETAFFRKNVVVTTPKYQMFTDSLVYEIRLEKMTFHGPTRIISDDCVLDGNHGWYDGINDVVYLDRNATITNEEYSISSESMYYDRNADFTKAVDNVVMTDTVNKATVLGNYAEMWKKLGKGFVTDSVRAMYYGDNDTLFLHSDTLFVKMDTIEEKLKYIMAYYNVRFFRDDLQGKCDSLCFTAGDSTVRMRGKPVIWAENSQLSGDSINIVVANSAIDSVLLYPNGFIIQQDTIEGFNQIKGKKVTSYFEKNDIDHVYDEGNAETAYWLREDDGSLIGINFSQSSSMDIKIDNRKIVRIKYFKKTTETLFPKDKMPPGKELLKDFEWLEETRPKDRLDIFRKPLNDNDTATEKPNRKKRK